jgi:DHA2 family methylenomycin A resistance protein-like MFS transporter
MPLRSLTALREMKEVKTVKSRSKALTLTAMSLGIAVVQLDITVVNVGVKAIGSSLGGSITSLQWVVGSYTLALAALILTAGALGDRIGARRMSIFGFAIFTCASVACGLAASMGLLIAARTVQGVGAAILIPCSLALLNHAYHDAAERARAFGLLAAGASTALAGGPVIGGVLIALVGWRGIFFINLPIGLTGMLLTARYASETPTSPGRGLDLAGQLSAVVALAALAAATIEGGVAGWSSAPVLAGFAVFLLGGAGFLAIEHRGAQPMLPLSLFAHRGFRASTLVGLFINVAFYGLIFVFSLLFQRVQGLSPLQAGLAFLPMTASIMVANLLAAPLVRRFGERAVIVAGQLLMAGGCAALLWISGATPYWAMAAQLLMLGAGLGVVVPPMTTALLASVDRSRSGIAGGTLWAVRQSGSVIGVALFGSLLAGTFIAGVHIALAVALVLLVLGALAGVQVAGDSSSSGRGRDTNGLPDAQKRHGSSTARLIPTRTPATTRGSSHSPRRGPMRTDPR